MKTSIVYEIANNTKRFLETIPKSERKKKGQFFTSIETALFMASMFNLDNLPDRVNVLDPGTGSGILSAAIIQRLNRCEHIKHISLTCYETDPDIQPLLEKNLETIKLLSNKSLDYVLIKDDYIITQQNEYNHTMLANGNPKKYHLIISNPPYLRIARNDPAAKAMPAVVHGAPNLYFLFAAMSVFNLIDDCEMVYIIPRSWTSGLYFTQFRKELLASGKLTSIHLFVSRDKVFKEEQVLQETIIIKVKKTKRKPKTVTITSSNSNNDFNSLTSIKIPYDCVVNGDSSYVFLPTNEFEMETINKVNRYKATLPEIGLRMKTGIVVDFRQWNELRMEPGKGIIPLFYSQHIREGRVNHLPSGKEYDWIIDSKPGLIQGNKNYVFCKRFTAKEEYRRLQCGVYLRRDFKQYSQIATHNKINYIDCIDGSDMDEVVAYGLYAILNTTLFDTYYRIMNGSTQVNSTEVNSIPFPPVNIIKMIGKRIIGSKDLSTTNCDKIVMEIAYEQD